MELTVRKSKNNEWGVVEQFSSYWYDGKGSVTITGCVTPEGKLSPPYALKGEEFVPLSVIEGSVGIERYLKAKKPIYSKLSDGFLVKIKAGLNYSTGEYLPEKSVAQAYKIVGREVVSTTACKIIAEPIVAVTDELSELFTNVSRGIVMCNGERVDYLKSRL